jgi:arylsulfatase A-like enzyme
MQYLKRTGLYDQSIVIVTSDHGESLGEDGRWGHAYTLYPEVVRIPLLIRVPPHLAVTASRTNVAMSTDITPTLYALTGQAPRDLGPLYGRPLFTSTGESAAARQDDLLLSSSYGPVHAMLRNNGQSLYVADAVQGRDFAFELRADDRMERVTVTEAMRAANRELMRDQITRIATAYKFSPAP